MTIEKARNAAVGALLGLALALAALQPALAQSSPAGNLRLVDAAGQTMEKEPAGPGEEVYRLPLGTTEVRFSFDTLGEAETPVRVALIGPGGITLYQESETYNAPGSHVFSYTTETPLDEGDYVVNLYVSAEGYLADSAQVLVGERPQLPTPRGGPDLTNPQVESTPGAEADMPDLAPYPEPGQEPESGDLPGGDDNMLLILAGLGMIALLAIVLWAGRSAMRRS